MVKQKAKHRILLTNDDGIQAPGLRALYEALSALGECTVIAPVAESSGVAHAITYNAPLKVRKSNHMYQGFGWKVSGTPADCVKFGVKQIFAEKPDLIVSGINQGTNTGVDTLYSGTVAGAAEGGLMNIPSFAISLSSYDFTDFSGAADCARTFAKKLLKYGLPDYTFLNINVPPVPKEQIAGIRFTHQGKARYDEFYENHVDDSDTSNFWLRGEKILLEHSEESDEIAVGKNFIAVTPLQHDLTDYDALRFFRDWDFSQE